MSLTYNPWLGHNPMRSKDTNPPKYLAKANEVLEETATRLKEILGEASSRLDPFPSFYGSLTIRAIEAEPPESQGSDRGCVVVCPDGNLYDLNVSFNSSPFGFSSNVEREEKLTKLNLPPLTYIPYAYNALVEVHRHLGGIILPQ